MKDAAEKVLAAGVAALPPHIAESLWLSVATQLMMRLCLGNTVRHYQRRVLR